MPFLVKKSTKKSFLITKLIWTFKLGEFQKTIELGEKRWLNRML
jgi:hypothetical protein